MSDQYPLGYNPAGLLPYRGDYNTYPIHCKSDMETIEGAFKRFLPLPTIHDVRKFALFGLKRLVDQEQLEEIDDAFVAQYLTSAINEIEMSLGMFLSPCEQTLVFDYTEGMFASNFSGMKVKQYPVTDILSVKLKFSHAMNDQPINEFTLPPSWISYRNRRINVLADLGTIKTTARGGDGTVFSFMAGYVPQAFRPNMISVEVLTGFPEGRVPAIVVDLVITVASIRLLTDVIPMLFPYSSVNVSIDGVSQAASLPGPNFLLNRVQALQTKRKEQESAIQASMGQQIKVGFIGA